MPEIAEFHPIIVHFVIALLFVGVGFRLVAFTGKLRFTDHGATALIVIGTLASIFAVTSGDQGHGPVERIPGADPVLVEHERLGERTRNLFLVVAALELVALAGVVRSYRKPILAASTVVGLAGCFFLFETAEHGGELVYSWAGGVGTRSGDPVDLERLLLAGLYHRSVADRREGRAADAATLTRVMTDRFADQYPNLLFFRVESLIRDEDKPREALDALTGAPSDSFFARYRQMWLTADAYEALGMPDSALITLKLHQDEYNNSAYLDRVAALEASTQ